MCAALWSEDEDDRWIVECAIHPGWYCRGTYLRAKERFDEHVLEPHWTPVGFRS